MKETTKGYEVITRLWNEEKGGYGEETTTFDSVKAAFTFANNFINANSQREKDEISVWVYDNEDNSDIFRMVNGRKAYGKPIVVGNRSAQRVDYAAIMEEVISEAENATEENTEITVEENAEVKKFEVGKTYYSTASALKIKVIKRTAKMIYIERGTNSIALSSRYVISEIDGVEFVNLGSYVNYQTIYADDTYPVESDNKKIVTTADLEEELAEVNNKISERDEDIVRYEHLISDYKYEICQCEKALESVNEERDELAKKAAAIENEIANRKLIDAIDDIGGSADAVDASATAMEELNSANNFTTNLLDAVNSAGKAVENAVTFELQKFAEDADIAECVATIDTSISSTVIAPADEDDVKTQAYLAEIADIDAQIAALQAKRTEKETELLKLLEGVTAWAYDKIKAVTSLDSRCLEIIAPARSTIFRDDFNELYFDCFKDGGFQISQYLHRLVTYSTAKQFKTAIRGLVAAIERGDEKFTFPADTK